MTEDHPRQIGRYRVDGELGRGGFGRVYRAFDPTVGRPVAIKVLTDVSADTQSRFRNEATVAGNLRHNNIVTVYEYGTYEGLPFLAMEYLEGEDLHNVIASRRPLSLLDKCNIMSQVADGLHYAHNNGVVHRDMKPANIMVLRDGTVKIMDFGIARLTRAAADATRLTQQGFLIGTLRYMAPEQFAGTDFDAQCDIFAYGTIFYELVTGTHPFEAPDAQKLMYRLSFEDPAPIRDFEPAAPDTLQQSIFRMIHKNRDRRYLSFKELQFDTEPVRIGLRKQRAAELLMQAGNLLTEKRLEPAKKVLQEVLGLDPSNGDARALWETLQQQLKHQTLQPRIEALLAAGEEHLEVRRFEDAAEAFEAALVLDRENVDIQIRIEKARALVEQARRASQLLADARREFERQNLTAAYRIVSKALWHDPKNPDAAEFLKIVQAYVERRQAEQRVDDAIRKAQGLLLVPAYDEAIAVLSAADRESPKIREWLERVQSEKVAHERKQRLHREMAAATDLLRDQHFDQAIQRLSALQSEFPNHPDLIQLLAYAQKEQTALARTKAVESAAGEARAAAERKDFEGALAALENALKKFPGESQLARLLAATEAEKGAWERQQAVQSTLAKCATLRSQQRLAEALSLVEAALKDHIAEPELRRLHKQLEVELTQQRRNQALRKITDEAEQLLARMQPGPALELLQRALMQYPGDAALEALLKRARDEAIAREKARADDRAARIEQRGREAAELSRVGEFDRALALLDDGLRTWPDAAALQDIRKATLAERERRAEHRRVLQDLEELRLFTLRESATSAAAEQLQLAEQIFGDYPRDPEIQSIAGGLVAVLSDIEKARRLLADGNYQAALVICERRLAQNANYAAFGEFKREAERGLRWARLEEVRRAAASEHDLKRRAGILERGLALDPGESTLAEELQFTRNRLALVDSIVEQARACERSRRWAEALEKWSTLLTVYGEYPGLQAELERVERLRKKALAVEQVLPAVDASTGPRPIIAPPAIQPAAGPSGRSFAARKGTLITAGLAAACLAGGMIIFRSRGPGEVTVGITANLPGATVSIGGRKCVTPNCTLKLPPGTYAVEGAVDGYAAVTQQLSIAPGQGAANLELVLKPLPELLRVNTNFESGQVFLDGRLEGALTDGQFTLAGITSGKHTLRVTGGGASFQTEWRSAAGAPPEVLQVTSGKDVQATVIANAGATGAIKCDCDPRQITVDGASAVDTHGSAAGPIGLKGLKEGPRQIALGNRSLVVDIRANPALNVFLAVDRNVGVLIVETGEDGVKVFLNNKMYRRTTEHGMLRIPIEAGQYSIRVDKDGFLTPPPQAVALKKGDEKPFAFQLVRALARLEIAGAVAGAHVRLDGQSIGETDRNGGFQHEVTPGPHTIELVKDEYAPVRLSEQFRAGKTLRLDQTQAAMAKASKTAPPDPRQLESQDWARIANSTNPDDFDGFLRDHPGGAHLEQARTRAGELRQQAGAAAAQQAEQAVWEKLDQTNREQLQDYLSHFPSGLHGQQARAKVAEIDRQASEALATQRLREQKDQELRKRAADEQAIAQVVKDFDTAYNRKDLASLQRLWSGVPAATLRQQFKEAKDLKFQLQLIGQPEVNGNSATAICNRSLSYRGQFGGPMNHSERVKVTLGRESSGWLIRSIDLN